MRLRNPKLEHRIILTACNNRQPRTKRVILAKTTPEDFALEPAAEIRAHLQLELQRGRSIPRAPYLADTPALSEEAQKLLRAPRQKQKEAARLSHQNVLRDIDELKRYRRVRAASEGLLKGGELLSGKVGPAEIQEFCDTLEKTLLEVRAEFDLQPIIHYGKGATKEDAKAHYRRLVTSAKHHFVSTGIDAIDEHLTGHSRGNLVVISAPRKGGKSTMAINMAINQFKQHHLNVLYVSLEMPAKDVEQRIAAKEGYLPYGSIRNPDQLGKLQKKKIEQYCKELFLTGQKREARFDIWPVVDVNFTPEMLRSGVQGMFYDVIYVDYLTLFSKKRQDLWEMQMEYSRYLKQMAKQLNCVVVTLTQVNANEQVKYGTAVEENLDTWFRWQWREDKEQETGEVELRLALCRHAPTTVFPAKFELDKMSIHVYSAASNKNERKTRGKRILEVNDRDFKAKMKRGEI